jgi:hypothetical protein
MENIENFILPYDNMSKTNTEEIVNLVETIFKLVSDQNELNQGFISLIQAKFGIANISKSLKFWTEIEFSKFLTELEKNRRTSTKESGAEYHKLNLSEEAEWMQYFNEQKQKAQDLKSEISRIENEIDQMVYELYGLTDAEIEIIENN